MIRRYFALLVLFLVSGSLAAQQKTATLTFKEAVKIGLDKNVTLNQQENVLVSSRVNKTAGLMGFGPSVAINGNTGRNDGNSFNQQEGRVINGVLDFTRASIDANMPLFRGLNTVNTYRQANSLYEAQLHTVNRTSQDVIRDVARQYLTCLLDQRLAAISETNVALQQKQFEQIQAHVEAGSRAEVDLRNQEYQVKNAELLLVRAKNTLRNDKAILSQTLQLDPRIEFDLEEPAWPISQLDEWSLEELYNLAEEKRSDLTRASENEKASQFGYIASKGTYFPSVTAFASYGSAYNYVHPSENFTPNNRTFEQQFFTDNTQLTYGISFRIPIHGAFATRSNVVRNRVLYENAKLETENTKNVVKSEVLLAHQNFNDAFVAYEAAEAQLKAAEVSYSLEQERYNLGISDIVAFTQAMQAYTRAQADFESARYTLMFQKLLINYATGTLSFEDIP